MSREEHQHMLRGYLERRYIDGLTAIDALMEMQEWVSENIRDEHGRVVSLAKLLGARDDG